MQGITEVLQKEFQRAFPKAEKRDSRLWTGLGTGPENRVSGLGDKAQGRRDKGQKERLWLLLKDLRLVLSGRKERLTEKSEEALGVDANRQVKRFSTLLMIQFSSVAQSCPTLFDPMNRSTPGLPVHHQLPEFTQTHVHRVI